MAGDRAVQVGQREGASTPLSVACEAVVVGVWEDRQPPGKRRLEEKFAREEAVKECRRRLYSLVGRHMALFFDVQVPLRGWCLLDSLSVRRRMCRQGRAHPCQARVPT